MSEHTPNKLKSLKTGGFERRWSLAKASLVAGTRLATANAASLFSSDQEKENG